MEKLTFEKLLREARYLKEFGCSKYERRWALSRLILGAKYYYVEQG